MTINLPDNLARSILAEVDSGHFASVDDAIAEAVRLLLREQRSSEAGPEQAAAAEQTPPAAQPIWEVFEEITASIPEEEWARMPTDGAEQHDHFISTTRQTARIELLVGWVSAAQPTIP